MRSFCVAVALVLVLLVSGPAAAQRRGFGATGVYKSRIEPHWFDGGARFWYQNDLARGAREFILVDAEKGTRARAFDHDRLAVALKTASDMDVRSDRLPPRQTIPYAAICL